MPQGHRIGVSILLVPCQPTLKQSRNGAGTLTRRRFIAVPPQFLLKTHGEFILSDICIVDSFPYARGVAQLSNKHFLRCFTLAATFDDLGRALRKYVLWLWLLSFPCETRRAYSSFHTHCEAPVMLGNLVFEPLEKSLRDRFFIFCFNLLIEALLVSFRENWDLLRKSSPKTFLRTLYYTTFVTKSSRQMCCSIGNSVVPVFTVARPVAQSRHRARLEFGLSATRLAHGCRISAWWRIVTLRDDV